jgi:hypothetical protein
MKSKRMIAPPPPAPPTNSTVKSKLSHLEEFKSLFGQVNFESLGVVPSLLPRMYLLIRIEQVYDECFRQLLRSKGFHGLDSSKAMMIAFGKGSSANQTQFWQSVCNFLYSVSKFIDHKEIALFSEFIKLGNESSDFLLYLCLRQFFKIITLIEPAKEKDVAEIFTSTENITKIIDKAFWSDADDYDRVVGHLNSAFESVKHVLYHEFLERVLEVDCENSVVVMLSDLLAFYQPASDKDVGYPRDHGNNIKRKNFVLKDFDLDGDDERRLPKKSRSHVHKPVNAKIRNKIAKKGQGIIPVEEPNKLAKLTPMKRSVVSHPNLINKRDASPIAVRKIDYAYNKKYKRGAFEAAKALAKKEKSQEQLMVQLKTPEHIYSSKEDLMIASENPHIEMDGYENEYQSNDGVANYDYGRDEAECNSKVSEFHDKDKLVNECESRPNPKYCKDEVMLSSELPVSERLIQLQEEKYETEQYAHLKNQFEMNLSLNSRKNKTLSSNQHEPENRPQSSSDSNNDSVSKENEDQQEAEYLPEVGLDDYQTYYKFKNKESLIGQSTENKYSRMDHESYEQLIKMNNLPEANEHDEFEEPMHQDLALMANKNSQANIDQQFFPKKDKIANPRQQTNRVEHQTVEMSSEEEDDDHRSNDKAQYDLSHSSDIDNNLISRIHEKIHSDAILKEDNDADGLDQNSIADQEESDRQENDCDNSKPIFKANSDDSCNQIDDQEPQVSRDRVHSLYSQGNYTSCPNFNGGRSSRVPDDIRADSVTCEDQFATASPYTKADRPDLIIIQEKNRHITFSSKSLAFSKGQPQLDNGRVYERNPIQMTEEASDILTGDDLISPFLQKCNEGDEFTFEQSFLKPVKFQRDQ